MTEALYSVRPLRRPQIDRQSERKKLRVLDSGCACDRRLSSRMRTTILVHSSQMKTFGPATNLATWSCGLRQKEHFKSFWLILEFLLPYYMHCPLLRIAVPGPDTAESSVTAHHW